MILMCLILFAYKVHPIYNLIVAANRDEFYNRPTASVHFWEDTPEILAGRDLEKRGTWMGVTTKGRFSALTNYRDPKESTEGKKSRGELVASALMYHHNIKEYLQSLTNIRHQYPGYNLLAGNQHDLYYYSNVANRLENIKPGIHGVSNHFLNTHWPKVEKGKQELAEILHLQKEEMVNHLFSILNQNDPFPDDQLPRTGVPLEWERMLSSLFIKSQDYGTRSSTVLLMSNEQIEFVERVYSNGEKKNDQTYTIKL
jgi:uncharacterized protein with NRDE domain